MSHTPIDTDTLAGLLADATPGEWEEITPEGGIWPPRVFSGSTIVSMVDNSDMTHGEKVANARLIALAPELAAEVISLRAQAAKDKARIEWLEAALKGARALLRSGADLLSIESEALRASITVNGELRPDPEDAPAVEAINEIEAWIADVAGFLNARAALEDRE